VCAVSGIGTGFAATQVASNTTKKSASKKSNLSKTGEYQNYRVQNGETFYSIAKKYPGVSAQNIMSWNGINNARRLKPGMTLKIYSES
jgi:membrane-bound lytic murein transglycosylase D